MATYNPHNNNANLLNSSISAISSAISSQHHYERNTTATTTTAFLLPAVASGNVGGGGGVTTSTAVVAPAPTATTTPLPLAPMQLGTFVTGSPHFMTHQHQQQQQHNHHHHHLQQQQQQQHHTTNASTSSSTSSYTLVQIKREPCQVSEVTSATNSSHHHHHHQQQQHLPPLPHPHPHNHHSLSTTTTHHNSTAMSAAASSSKTMASLSSSSSTSSSSSSSTLTTLVKIEPPSPKVHDMDKSSTSSATLTATTSTTNSSVPIGIAVARKRPQESNSGTLGNANSLPMQQTLNKDMNCFGIRMADLGGVGTGCGNFYFTGNGDLMTSSTTAEEFALSAAAQSVNRAPSTFWQYPNTLPIESVISMSPATLNVQYSRDASRGVFLLPATAAALGISNFPLYTPTDPFQQAAFVWPPYIPQNTAPAALQPPNFIFPSMSSHSTLQAPSYATPLQLFGTNYLTAAAAAAAAAAATSTLCQHSQQQTTISAAATTNGLGRFMNTTTTSTDMQKSLLSSTSSGGSALAASSCSSSSSSSSSTKHMLTNSGMTMSLATSMPPMTPLHTLPPPHTSLILPPHPMKLEEWNSDFMTAAIAKSSATGTLHAPTNSNPTSLIVPAAGTNSITAPPPVTMLNHNHTTGLLDLGPSPGGALNLIRLPTPPSSATMESAAAAAVAPQMHPHLVFHPATSTSSPTVTSTPATLLNLSVTTTATPHATNLTRLSMTPTNSNGFVNGSTATPTFGPPTPLAEELQPMNFKTDLQAQQQQIVVGVPRDASSNNNNSSSNNNQQVVAPPQMQDVNIQTDTPVCSEDENSSCPLAIQQQQHQTTMLTTNGDVTSTINQSPLPPPQTPLTAIVTSHNNNNNNNNNLDAAQLYAQTDSEAQQPLELTKNVEGKGKLPNVETTTSDAGGLECHRREDDKTNGASSETSPLKDNNNYKKQPVSETPVETMMTSALSSASASTSTIPVISHSDLTHTTQQHHQLQQQQQQPQASAEDLTGLELLSNISASTLAKTSSTNGPMLRIKQEPLDHGDILSQQQQQQEHSMLMAENIEMLQQQQHHHHHHEQPLHPPHPPVENFGGLNLLCALAEQLQEEEVQTGGLFATASPLKSADDVLPHPTNLQRPPLIHTSSFPGFHHPLTTAATPSSSHTYRREHSFPSMESIELPTTSGGALGGCSFAAAAAAGSMVGDPVKRKKHKHSKSLKTTTTTTTTTSSSSTSLVSSLAASSSSVASSSKSQRCSKKSKKKNAKEKHHKHHATDADTMDWGDEQLQEDIKDAFNSVDPSIVQRVGKLSDAYKLISLVESSVRDRLADITRQYRKKKRKLDQICKSKLKLKKKKKKCSKLAALALQEPTNAAAAATNTSTTTSSSVLSLGGVANGVTGGSAASTATSATASRCDYNFTKFSNTATTAVSVTSTYLHNTSFLRFGDQSSPLLARTQFPPPPAPTAATTPTCGDNGNGNAMTSEMSMETSSLPAYKPVRLEPSTLGASSSSTTASSSIMRSAQKRASSEKSSPNLSPKERKLLHAASGNSNGVSKSRRSSGPEERKKPHPLDREVMLTGDHLYRKETRVLTDMGGLFYAGVLKPLQPPDVYAITLDGERGNKSHIMSREEILKDTILEITPKSKDIVPVGTRLCAYWSQQYRCLYPGRAIESESSEDDDDANGSNDFVSVEFDDGDSGRIRLHNIRLLLSDYPIVEYNENPLSTLGKQKKSSLGVGAAFRSPTDQPLMGGRSEEASQSLDTQQQQQQQQLLIVQQQQLSVYNDLQQQQQQEAREVYAAKRIERKRKKSLKKKTQQAANATANTNTATTTSSGITTANTTTTTTSTTLTASPATTNGLTCAVLNSSSASLNGSDIAATGDSNDFNRKHHKHKKHKKHKKQRHHRKALATAQLASTVDDPALADSNALLHKRSTAIGGAATMTSPFVGKQEIIEDNDVEDDEDDDEDDDDDDGDDEVPQEQSANDDEMAEAYSASALHKAHKAIYTNGNGTVKLEHANHSGVRVKTEHLDFEEETASNLMSEVSDEVKGDDEIEHKNSKGSKIAAFLPDRQLWGWLGKAYRKAGVKGRARKQFYKTIKRGKEKITVGDCAVFLSTGRPDRPYIGRIESMWETTSSNKVVRVRWFYHPEETKGCPDLKYPGALFESPHEDENDVQTISHHCEVLPFERYFSKFGADSKQYQLIYDNNDTYYLAGSYNPRAETLKLQPNIPTLEEPNTDTNSNAIAAATQGAAANTTTTISATTN